MRKFLLFACILVAVLTAQGKSAASAVPIENNAQYKAQISFFKGALDEFGAPNPDEAVRLWVKADETRNGVFKYAVGSDKVKQWLTSKWGNPEENFWIIGGSSPWLSGHKIESRIEVSPTEIKYTVKYYWSTSAGQEEPSVERLTVTKETDKWYVSKVNPVTGPQYY